jgi:hypothetical protein
VTNKRENLLVSKAKADFLKLRARALYKVYKIYILWQFIKKHSLMAAATHDLPLWNGVEKINYSLIKPKLYKNVISNQAKYEA